MAKQQKRTKPFGKAQASKPITSHPLFPAVVALWFGALFGLGSLAVRPSLLESLVIKSRLDLVVPAAAPPLGITARMLIALILAAIGAAIGIAVARRIARPKVEQRQRKRGARSGDAELSGYASRTGYAAPLSIHDEIGEEDEPGSLMAGRRRSALAIEHEEPDFVPHEMAPLPGGAPQVLNISGIELGDYAPIEAAGEPAPLDLGAFAASSAPPAPPPFVAPAAFAPPAAPALEERQVFQPAPFAPPATEAAAEQTFAPAPQPAEPAPQPRLIFGMPIEDDHVDQSLVRAAGFKTTVFETEEHEPLFPGRAVAQAETKAAVQSLAPDAQPAFAAPGVAAADSAAQAAIPAVAAAPVAPVEPLPPVAGLGMTDLATRLQQSMQRRRAARAGGETQADAPLAAPDPVVAAPSFAPPPFESLPEVAPVVEAMPAPELAAHAPAMAMESLLSPAPAHAAPDPAAVVPPAPMAMPAALRPLNLDVHDDDDDDMLASLLPPRNIALPVSAPAVSFAAPLVDEPSEVPAMEAPAPFAAPQSPAEPVAFEPVAFAPMAGEPEVGEVDANEDQSYASLLDIGQPLAARTQFVRIEEHEAADAAVEPVVIFPGQAPLGAPAAQFAAPATENDTVPFRRFDAPSAAGQGGPVSSPTAQQASDPAEAEQALRAALANLQRMSGAA